MGNRAQVFIKDKGVYLYTHWRATELSDMVTRVISRQERWYDPEYLARIIFSEMIKDDISGATGFGIGTEKHGDIWRLVEVDCGNQTITIMDDGKPPLVKDFKDCC